MRNEIHHDVRNSKFCIIIDETHNESKREQMTIVLRYVDNGGFIRECFFDFVHVKDTTIMTLKKDMMLFRHCLDIQSICGQRYDVVCNMQGEWNCLQTLFLNDCPCAYYVHYLAHRLQLALLLLER